MKVDSPGAAANVAQLNWAHPHATSAESGADLASAQTAQHQQDTGVARRLVSASNVPILLHVYRLNKAAQGIYRQIYGARSSSNVAFPPVA